MTRPRITIIAALDRDGGIGRRGDLLFHISADLRRFKAITTGHAVIMGRRTFESFPKGPLPDRRNIVITRNADYSHPGIETAPSPEAAIAMCDPSDEIFIIGGGEIYHRTFGMADRLLITRVDATEPDADTFFPAILPEEWRVTDTTAPECDPRSGLTYQFVEYLRNS